MTRSPPAVPFKKDSPWQADGSTPAPKGRAECIVQVPDQEAKSDGAESNRNHLVHRLDGTEVSLVNPRLLGSVVDIDSTDLGASFRLTGRPKAYFHTVQASEEDDGSEQSERILVEQRVLDVIVVRSNKGCDEDSQSKNQGGARGRTIMGEGGIKHDACGVNRGKLVQELHAICIASVFPRTPVVLIHAVQARVEQEASQTDD